MRLRWPARWWFLLGVLAFQLIPLASTLFIHPAYGRNTSPLLTLPLRTIGVDYGPFREGQQPGGPCPSLDEVRSDLGLLRRMANTVRTYGLSDCHIGETMVTAVQGVVGLHLCLGLWLGPDATANAQELAELTRL
jgi:exo-beta-1,3-glucanase (GH17 family)